MSSEQRPAPPHKPSRGNDARSRAYRLESNRPDRPFERRTTYRTSRPAERKAGYRTSHFPERRAGDHTSRSFDTAAGPHASGGPRYPRNTNAHSRSTPTSRKPLFLLILIGSIVIVLAAAAVVLVKTIKPSNPSATGDSGFSLSDKDQNANGAGGEQWEVVEPTPLVAQYGDVLIHLPVSTDDLTEVAFHQTEVPWGLVMQTELPSADPAKTEADRGTGRPKDQPSGDVYLDGSALHLGRTKAYTEMDTALDCGAPIGSTVYSPIDGTVVLVREYTLDDTLQDYCVHIEPTGHPELDLCVIHIDDVSVKEGDEVIGGVTPIAKIRDLQSFLSGIQLATYTAEGDGGNHAHVQMNDKTYENYPYPAA